MEQCPLCNGFVEQTIQCSNCHTIMEDRGKLTDYFDDYSAYMDIDIMKLYDGEINSLENHECLHVLYCHSCQHEETKSFHEQ